MHSSTRGMRRRLRLGVLGMFAIGLGAVTLLWQQGRAGGAPFEPKVAAVFAKNELKVGVGLTRDSEAPLRGTLVVELADSTGRPLDRFLRDIDQKDAQAQYQASFNTDPSQADKLQLRVSLGRRKAEIPLKKALLVKAHETSLTAGTEYYAGSQVALRCGVHGVQSLTDILPLPGSTVEVRVKDKAGKVHELYKGKTGDDGLANVTFEMPSLEAGQYDLEVSTRSVFGQETLTHQIRVKSDAKVLLVSDKPIYQPGQLVHLRALALRSFDQKPVGDKDILFEVEDSKGNKVYKRTFKTNDFGVASVDFQLADEVNMGDYHIRAVVGEARAEKTVNVKRYVLPKFKVEVTADKKFYLPKETIKAELQSDYFFGKPVAKAKIEVTASTFDVAFRKFQTWNGTTDDAGHAKFEIQLPDYFVGQPLQKGDALVKLDVKVLDSADHTETIAKAYTVSDQSIRINLLPEGGKLVPGLENRLFAAATYPDGSPAADCEVKIWHRKEMAQQQGVPLPGPRGRGLPPPKVAPGGGGLQPIAVEEKEKEKEAPLASVKTNAAGLAEIKLTPKAEQFRQGQFGQRDIETLGGKQVGFGPAILFDVHAEAKDPKGSTAAVNVELNSHPLGENVLLRLDKAIYQTGDIVNIDIRSSAGLPTAYIDVIRGGQLMLSRWLDVKDGQASQKLDLPPSVYGSIEIHAYQMLATGEIIRDSRVVYVQPKNDLKIDIQSDKEYAPGDDARIRFTVTDADGKPTQAALGVIVVDEAVYALQEMQPGLEKLYFTLQEELLKPQVQIKLSEGLDNIVLQPVVPAPRQQIAEVLLTSVKLPPPARWNVAPAIDRKQRAETQVAQIGNYLYWYASNFNNEFQQYSKAQQRWIFRPDLLEEVTKRQGMPPDLLNGVFGEKITFQELAKLEKEFTPDHLARAVTAQRLNQVMWSVVNFTNQNRAKYFQNDRWVLPENIVADVVAAQRLHPGYGKDAWGQPFRLVKRATKSDKPFGNGQFDLYDMVSAGPDGKIGTKDDVTRDDAIAFNLGRGNFWWMGETKLAKLDATARFQMNQGMMRGRGGANLALERAAGAFADGLAPPGPFGGGLAGAPAPRAAMPLAMKAEKAEARRELRDEPANRPGEAKNGHAGGEAPITKVREYFPETMLWQPSLITDEKGVADLAVNFADSITTWRLTASANARTGALGGATAPLKVFQDFFVDIDLPVSLTQGDEVAFPVAIYNYLKEPQKLKVQLEKEPWFELLDSPRPGGGEGSGVRGSGFVRTIDVKAGDVTSVKFRIKANRLGNQPLTVKAFGSKKSDAVKRVVEVVPNGQRFEKVVSDRLTNPDRQSKDPFKIKQTIAIPDDAIPDASKLLVRIYPGVMAQVLEGVEGMIRLPGG